MPDPAIDLKHVTHRYGDHVALRDVSFQVPSGSLFGLLGPNGSGKTTLFRILSTLLPPTEGKALVFGLDTTTEAEAARARTGIIFQHPALDNDLSIQESLLFQGALYGLHGASLRQRIDNLLDVFDLRGRRKDRIKTLSGGLQRQVDLIRGLLHRPSLLLLDEPTTGLDPLARMTFWQALARLRHQEATTMVVATHLMEEAAACDLLGIIDKGRLAAYGSPDTLTSALGSETLWLEADDAVSLRDQVENQLGFDGRILGRFVQISHPEAHTLLATLYESFGDQIQSATIRKPTLEDVFMVHTGHAMNDRNPVATSLKAA